MVRRTCPKPSGLPGRRIRNGVSDDAEEQRNDPRCDATDWQQYPANDAHTPNENKMSDGGRGRASLAVKM